MKYIKITSSTNITTAYCGVVGLMITLFSNKGAVFEVIGSMMSGYAIIYFIITTKMKCFKQTE